LKDDQVDVIESSKVYINLPSNVQNLSNDAKDELIIDSGATISIVKDPNLFEPGTLTSMTNKVFSITGITSNAIKTSFKGQLRFNLGPALYVPTLTINILSLSTIIKYNRYFIFFINNKWHLLSKFMNTNSKFNFYYCFNPIKNLYFSNSTPATITLEYAKILFGTFNKSLNFYLSNDSTVNNNFETHQNNSNSFDYYSTSDSCNHILDFDSDGFHDLPEAVQSRIKSVHHIHKALSHVSLPVLSQMINKNIIQYNNITSKDIKLYNKYYGTCPDCTEGKLIRKPISADEYGPVSIGSHFHSDLFFFTDVPSSFLILVDQLSAFTIVKSLPDKKSDTIYRAIESIHAKLLSYNRKFSTLFCDSESVFKGAESNINKLGVKLIFSAPDDHTNVAERRIRVVRERVLATLYSLCFKLPIFLFSDLVEFVVQSLNMCTTTKNSNSTPYQLLTNQKINSTLLNFNFGELGLFRKSSSNRDHKLKSKTDIGVVINRDLNSNGTVKIFSLRTSTFSFKRLHEKLSLTPENILLIRNSFNKFQCLDLDPLRSELAFPDNSIISTASTKNNNLSSVNKNNLLSSSVTNRNNKLNFTPYSQTNLSDIEPDDTTTVTNVSDDMGIAPMSSDSFSDQSNNNSIIQNNNFEPSDVSTSISDLNDSDEMKSDSYAPISDANSTSDVYNETITELSDQEIVSPSNSSPDLISFDNPDTPFDQIPISSLSNLTAPANSVSNSPPLITNGSNFSPTSNIVGVPLCKRKCYSKVGKPNYFLIKELSHNIDNNISYTYSWKPTKDLLKYFSASYLKNVIPYDEFDSNLIQLLPIFPPVNELDSSENYSINLIHEIFHVNLNIDSEKELEDIAMQEEFRSLLDFGTFDPMDPKLINLDSPEIKSKMVNSFMLLKRKLDSQGIFVRMKGRLVANGRGQPFSTFDSSSINAPTVRPSSVKTVLNIVAFKNLELRTVDIKSAFLRSNIDHDVYVRIPSNLVPSLLAVAPEYSKYVYKGSIVMKLAKALYGLCQSPSLWNRHLGSSLQKIGFCKSLNDPCLYYVKDPKSTGFEGYLCIHVDDILVACSTEIGTNFIINSLRKIYKDITVCDDFNCMDYLGCQIIRSRLDRSISINQKGLIQMILKDNKIDKSISVNPASHKLFETTVNDDMYLKYDENFVGLVKTKSPKDFLSILMTINYLTLSRADLLLPVSYLCTRVSNPNLDDWKKLYRIMFYLNGTIDFNLILKPNDLILKCQSDASFAVHSDRKSHTGVICYFGDISKYASGIISAYSNKQKLNSKSSFESEILALNSGVDEVVFLKRLLDEIGIPQPTIAVFQDNQSTIYSISTGSTNHKRTKHIDVKYFYLKNRIDLGQIKLIYLETDNMVADVLTKPLYGTKYKLLTSNMMCNKLLIDTNSSRL
jgi:hypothetical protein